MHKAKADVHTRYGTEIAVMQEMNWSCSDLAEAPADMVEEIIERVNARHKWEKTKREIDEAKNKPRKR